MLSGGTRIQTGRAGGWVHVTASSIILLNEKETCRLPTADTQDSINKTHKQGLNKALSNFQFTIGIAGAGAAGNK